MSSRRRLGTLVACLAVLAPAGVSAQVMSYERIRAALENVHQFQQVAVSPDGRRFLSVETYALPAHRAATGMALLVADVARPATRKRLSACPATLCDEGDAAWSPDSRAIAFITNAPNGQGQIALADAASGRVRILTSVHGPISSPKWSHDGKRIAFLFAPGAPKRPSPLNPAQRDAGVVGATPVIQHIAVVPANGGTTRVLGPADLNIYEYDWAPDDARFAATAAHGDGDANWWVADLVAVDARTGGVTKLFHPPLQIASPRWSPDGSRIAFIAGIMSDESITGGDLQAVPAAGGDATTITPNLAASVYAFAWTNGRHILANELQGGATALADVDADAHTQTVAWKGEITLYATGFAGIAPGDVGISTSRDGRVTAAIRQSITLAPEIELGPIGAWRVVTNANAATAHLTGPARSISWKSDAFTPQGWVVLPSDYVEGRTLPVITYIHGGPAYAHYPLYPSGAFAFTAWLASRGYAVFEPNPRGSYGQGEAFTQANVKDFGYGDLRDITTGLDAVAKTINVAPNRNGIFGWSYGGYMTMWSVTQTNRFRAAVSGAGLSDWQSYYGTNDIDTWMIPYFGASVYDDPAVYARSSPITFIKAVKTPMLMVHGDADAEVPVTQSYEYWHALRALGIPAEFVVYPGEGHEFFKPADQVDVARRIVGWFDRWLR